MTKDKWEKRYTDGLWHHYSEVQSDDGSVSYYIDGALNKVELGDRVKVFKKYNADVV